jgi:hypothetical protein
LLHSYGPNALTPPKKPGFWAKLWAQLNNVLIFILLAAAVVVAGLQEWIEFGLILGVVSVNVMIGMVQEGKAEKAAEAIKAMLSSSGGCIGGTAMPGYLGTLLLSQLLAPPRCLFLAPIADSYISASLHCTAPAVLSMSIACKPLTLNAPWMPPCCAHLLLLFGCGC